MFSASGSGKLRHPGDRRRSDASRATNPFGATSMSVQMELSRIIISEINDQQVVYLKEEYMQLYHMTKCHI